MSILVLLRHYVPDGLFAAGSFDGLLVGIALKVLSKMESFEINFDENGVPLWPQFFLTEDARAEILRSMSSPTPEQVQKLDELVAKKRREFDEREARRRLVD